MNRRDALRLALGFPASLASMVVRGEASGPRQARTVGILSDLPVTGPDEWASSPFWAPLRSLGWVEGRNLRIERASAERRLERLPGLARKLVDADVDVIFTAGNEAALAAARATRHIPIVFWGVTFPVEMGLVASLARPQGNVTGVALHLDPDEGAKALDFLRELAPGARRLAYLHETMLVHRVDEASTLPPPDNLEEAAGQRGFLVERHPVGEGSALGETLERIARSKAEAISIGYSQMTVERREEIATFSSRARIPSVAHDPSYVGVGGLLAYGPDIRERFRQAASMVDKVLRGRRPSELPVDLPGIFDLGVNVRTAAAIGVDIPRSLLLRATRVVG